MVTFLPSVVPNPLGKKLGIQHSQISLSCLCFFCLCFEFCAAFPRIKPLLLWSSLIRPHVLAPRKNTGKNYKLPMVQSELLFKIFTDSFLHSQRILHHFRLRVWLENSLSCVNSQNPKRTTPDHSTSLFLTFLNSKTFLSTLSSSALPSGTPWESLLQSHPWEINLTLGLLAAASINTHLPHVY